MPKTGHKTAHIILKTEAACPRACLKQDILCHKYFYFRKYYDACA